MNAIRRILFAVKNPDSKRQRGIDKALKVMNAVDPEALKAPSTALCYGLLLSAKGDTAGARKYLQLASAGQLLPEEKLLAGRELERLPVER